MQVRLQAYLYGSLWHPAGHVSCRVKTAPTTEFRASHPREYRWSSYLVNADPLTQQNNPSIICGKANLFWLRLEKRK